MRMLCAVLTVLVGCSGATGNGVSGAAELACDRFRTAGGESRTLTTAELRERLQDVHRLARNSESATLGEAGEDMLAGITQGDVETYSEAVDRFEAECRQLGH